MKIGCIPSKIGFFPLNEVLKQKPANKVEPKFKVGDWIVKNDDSSINIDYSCCKITKVENGNYTIESIYGYKGYNKFETFEKDYHLWTIQDAKDGDVLFTSSTASHETFIFKNIDEKGNAKCYFAYDSEDGFREGKYHFIGRAVKCKPATKEQRNLLFTKMKEAGYEWDVEKLESKKIEQNPAWSEEDENKLSSVLFLLHECKNYNFDRWFKSLKDRVQLKQEWSKEDKERYISCLQRLSTGNPEQPETINSKWFKEHVYPKSQWKPSDEQMETLEYYMHTLVCNKYKEILFGLYTDLKKLKE